jgi:hypothetical protein
METIRKINNYVSSYWFIIIFSAVLWTYLKIGKLPSFSSPDPKEIFSDFDILFAIYTYSTFFMLLGMVLNIWFLIKNLKNIGKVFEKSTIFFAANISLWLIEIFIDPMGFNAWFFD